MNSDDLNVRAILSVNEKLLATYQSAESAWVGSQFAWIKTKPSRQVGAIGEGLVSGWLTERGFSVSRSPDSEADRVVQGKRIEIKFSTLWLNGSYKFQQIRDQRYDIMVCLGLSPRNIHCWVIPKEDLLDLWKVQNVIPSQHGGARGSDTAWLTVDPLQPQSWLESYGGTLESAIALLAKHTEFQPK